MEQDPTQNQTPTSEVTELEEVKPMTFTEKLIARSDQFYNQVPDWMKRLLDFEDPAWKNGSLRKTTFQPRLPSF